MKRRAFLFLALSSLIGRAETRPRYGGTLRVQLATMFAAEEIPLVTEPLVRFDEHGEIKSRNVAVTFDMFEAEDHRNKGVENGYDTFVVPGDWREEQ